MIDYKHFSAALVAVLCLGCSSTPDDDADTGTNDMSTASDIAVGMDSGPSDMRTAADMASHDTGGPDTSMSDTGPIDLGSDEEVVQAVLAAVNEVRASEQQCGSDTLGPGTAVAVVPELVEAAQRHANDMAAMDELTFTGSDGSTGRDRVEATGWSGMFLNESISRGMPTAQEVVDNLMSSEGTCQNLMVEGADSFGVGRAEGPEAEPYWSVVLGAQ